MAGLEKKETKINNAEIKKIKNNKGNANSESAVPEKTVATGMLKKNEIRSFGDLLRGSWQIFNYALKNYLLFFLISFGIALVFIFTLLPLIVIGVITKPVSMSVLVPIIAIGVLLVLVFILASAVIGLAIDHSIFFTGEGSTQKVSVSLKFAFSNLGSLLLVSIISGLIVFSTFILSFLLAFIISTTLIYIFNNVTSLIIVIPIAIVLFVLIIMPSIFVSLMLSQIWPVFVLEGKRGREVIASSMKLTKGYKWAILGRYTLLYLCIFAITLIVSAISVIPVIGMAGSGASLVISVIETPMIIAFGYLVYKDLVTLQLK